MNDTHPVQTTGAEQDQPMTRALLEAGGLDALVRRDAPHIVVLSTEERDASLRAMLATRSDGPLWLFAYGSLMWNPVIRIAEERRALIDDWHRAFCLITEAGRGSPTLPGLVLALEEGGSCDGVALRVANEDVESELSVLWQREMLTGAYVPRWLELMDPDGEPFGQAIAFTMNRQSHQYGGHMARRDVVRRLATGAGTLGTSADYLRCTIASLHARGIVDPPLDRLLIDVEHEIKALGSSAARGRPE